MNKNFDSTYIVDFFDTPLLVAPSVNIPASSSPPLEVVASLAASVQRIWPMDTTGRFIGLYSGAVGSEVLQVVIGMEQSVYFNVRLKVNDRISIRNMEDEVISIGNLCVEFFG